MPDVNLMWRKMMAGVPVQVGPSLLVKHQKQTGVLMLAHLGPMQRRHGTLDAVTAYERQNAIKRFFRQTGDRQTFPMKLEDGTGKTGWSTYVSDCQPWLPAPGDIPGQTKWRFEYSPAHMESGWLTVTTSSIVVSEWKSGLELSPTLEATVAGVADVKASLGKLVQQRQKIVLSALEDPPLSVELLLPWGQDRSDSLAQMLREYSNSVSPPLREDENGLNSRMHDAGLIGDRPDGWEVYLENVPSSLQPGETADVVLVAASRGNGRVMAAIRVTDLNTGAQVVSDLVEIERE